MRKILTVIGTRPQFIKYAAVSSSLRRVFNEVLVDTGQHYSRNLSSDFISEFSFPRPHYSIGASETDSIKQITFIMNKLNRIIQKEKPAFMVCFGDTNSTLASAITALRYGIPVAHIEAGERNYNMAHKRVPSYSIPEEANRTIVDSISSLLLCASRRAVKNLSEEKVTGKIRYTGDIMYDLYKKRIKHILKNSDALNTFSLSRGNYYYCTIHRVLNTTSRERMHSILNAFKKIEKTIIFPLHPGTKKRLVGCGLYGKFSKLKNLKLTRPVSYGDSISLNYHSAGVLTDSGGVVREAFFNGVPSVLLDDTSEWLDLFLMKWSVLTGADTGKIVSAVENLNKPTVKPDIFGNGNAAKKTVKYLTQC